MVVSALFKETSGQDHVCDTSDAGVRRVQFWLHQRTRLTDGHVAFDADGKNRIVLNWTTKGKPADIATRARYETVARQTEGGMTVWTDAKVSALLSEMNVPQSEKQPTGCFVDAVLAPVLIAERRLANRLSIQWDVAERDIQDAIGLRYTVVQKAEAILNDAGLLVDQSGTLVPDDDVSAVLEVSEFDAARTLLWSKLSAEERRYNCRITQAG